MRSLISSDFPAPEMEPESAHVVSAVSVPWLQCGDCNAAPPRPRQHSPIRRYSALLRYSVKGFNSITQCTVKVPLSQPCFDHFFGPCFRGHDEAGLLAFSMSLFSDVGPLEAIAENKTEQKSAAKRRQRLLKAPLKPPSYDACFPTARSV